MYRSFQTPKHHNIILYQQNLTIECCVLDAEAPIITEAPMTLEVKEYIIHSNINRGDSIVPAPLP